MDIRWLFFDIGSTLVDEEPAYQHRIRDMIVGTDLRDEDVNCARIAFAKHGFDGNQMIISHFGLEKTPWHSEDEHPYPETRAILEHCKTQGYRLGIIANQIPGTAQRLAQWDIASYFDVVAASAELGVAKPNPEIFRTALAMADCTPSQAAMIGDRIDNDILPAKQLGMYTIWVRQGIAAYQPRSMGADIADVIVDSLWELRDVL